MNSQLSEEAARLLGSPLLFTQVFFELRTGRQFRISNPCNREPHAITISKAFKKVISGEIKRLIILIPPRYGKSELVIHFIPYGLALFPDSQFLYISYSKALARKQTQTIRDIISLKEYRKIFNISISEDTAAKDDFSIISGGNVYAAGSGGTITGRGAGIMGCDRFSGCIIIDDIHKPDEVTSDTIRQGVKDWYYNTLQSRLNNGEGTPIIIIGQLLHEDDLPSHLLKEGVWDVIRLPALDDINNSLYPEMHTTADLLKMKEENPYIFSLQYQQVPVPSGGGIFKENWFVQLNYEPKMLATFITVDTAETDKEYNDATVFSFWGIYKIDQGNIATEALGLHWIDCVSVRIQPKDLESEFISFYMGCMNYKVKPDYVCIEKKSTGTTLVSVLDKIRGLNVLPIERSGFINNKLNNKTNRFLEAQTFVAKKLVSLPENAKHTQMCINHMIKITANNTHRFDDIADTLCDAIYLTFINKFMIMRLKPEGDDIKNNFLSKLSMDAIALKKSIINRR